MKNSPIYRRIYGYEMKNFINHQDTLEDYVLLILTIVPPLLVVFRR